MTDNQERQALLLANLPLQFGRPEKGYEYEAERFYRKLSPAKRIEWLGEMYQTYVNYHNDQQKELARVSGDS